MMKHDFTRRGAMLAAGAAMICGLAGAQSSMEPKDIYEKGINIVPGAGSSTAALKYDVLLQRADRADAVAASRRFVDGDEFRLRFEVNKESYVYVLHRTLDGNPDEMERYTGAKGIRTIHEEDRGSNTAGKYRLLYPTPEAGYNNRLLARRPAVVPEGGRSFFQMDNHPGIEKLVIVVSPEPLDVSRIFSLTSGPSRPGNGRRDDSDRDIDNQLKSAEDNTVDSKGICVGPCKPNYAAPVKSGKPIVVNVDLRHYGR